MHEHEELEVSSRQTRSRRALIQTIGGAIGGTAGLVFAFIALLKYESAALSTIGFVAMAVSYGIARPEQVTRLLGRGE